MKKFLIVLLVLCSLFALTSCKEKEDVIGDALAYEKNLEAATCILSVDINTDGEELDLASSDDLSSYQYDLMHVAERLLEMEDEDSNINIESIEEASGIIKSKIAADYSSISVSVKNAVLKVKGYTYESGTRKDVEKEVSFNGDIEMTLVFNSDRTGGTVTYSFKGLVVNGTSYGDATLVLNYANEKMTSCSGTYNGKEVDSRIVERIAKYF